MFRVGLGRADITVYEHGMCMFGWGQPANVALSVAHPLFARSIVVECPRTRRRVAYVCADLGFISQHLHQKVFELVAERGLGLSEHDVMITATHTHSGPNGYSTYLFYSVTGPGYSARVVDGLARGIVSSIEKGIATLSPSRMYVHSLAVPLAKAVSFNRSVEAYNLNEDVTPVPLERSDEAVDRTLTVLRVDDPSGRPRGLVCWFPVHGTSIHFDNTRIHPDNKGVAARLCEERATRDSASDEPFVAIFAQEAAGDVTPNYRWNAKRRLLVGAHEDDLESAEHAGRVQAEHTWEAFREAPSRGAALHGDVGGRIRYRDFTSIAVDPEFAGGREGASTSVACLGLGFAYGTREGPGPAFALRRVNPLLSSIVAWRRGRRRRDWRSEHGRKVRFFDLGRGARGNIMTFLPVLPLPMRLLPDTRVVYYRRLLDGGTLRDRPWVPQVLPSQILRIGALAIVGVPVEPTTVSGRRMRAAVMSPLAKLGVERVIVNGYANAYASYVTTHEEYQRQAYEGASTLFGRWTLAAWCTELRKLARAEADGVSGDGLGDVAPQHRDHELLPAV